MLHTGLCSITFRKHSIDKIIELAQKGGIQGIEWGGDVHVPPADLENARAVSRKTTAAGLSICCYGSYYRCDGECESFADVLETADALGAPTIRVWAGRQGSEAASPEYRREVIEHLKRAVVAAREMDIVIGLEYHRNTLTDTQASAHQLLTEVALSELKLFWQPRTGGDFENDLLELDAALPHLANVHCFHWGPGGSQQRYPLLEGTQEWQAYLERIRQVGGDRYITLEFTRGDEPEQFIEDAKVLKSLLQR